MSAQNSDSEVIENKSSGLFSLPSVFLKKLYSNYDQAKQEKENPSASVHKDDVQVEGELSEVSKTLLSLINSTQKLFQNDEAFIAVKDLAYEAYNDEKANQVLLALTSVIRIVNKKFCIEKKEELFQLPSLILKNFKFSKQYQDKSNDLKNKCNNIKSVDELNICFQSAYNLFYSVYQDAYADKEELEKFLFNIGARINSIGDKLHAVAEEQESDIKIQGDLNLKMNDTVRLISNNIFTGSDLASLKNTVKVQLDSLQSIIEEERKIVKTQETRIQNNVKVLANRVHELQKEAQELRDKVQHEREKALKDSLTGINNRQAYNEKALELIQSDDTSTCLLIWDIDHFKRFNDQYGHAVGDKVLKAVADKMKALLKKDYFLARYGGEEFAMLLPGVSSDDAIQFANGVREEVSKIVFLVKGKKVKITVSCGIASYQYKDSQQTLFERADQALYTAKQEGRDRVSAA